MSRNPWTFSDERGLRKNHGIITYSDWQIIPSSSPSWYLLSAHLFSQLPLGERALSLMVLPERCLASPSTAMPWLFPLPSDWVFGFQFPREWNGLNLDQDSTPSKAATSWEPGQCPIAHRSGLLLGHRACPVAQGDQPRNR